MKEHPETRLTAYLDGALPPDERAAVQAHLADCSECARTLADMAALGGLFIQMGDPAEAVPPGYFDSFASRVRQQIRGRRRRVVPAWTWAAAAAMAVAAVAPLVTRGTRPEAALEPSAAFGARSDGVERAAPAAPAQPAPANRMAASAPAVPPPATHVQDSHSRASSRGHSREAAPKREEPRTGPTDEEKTIAPPRGQASGAAPPSMAAETQIAEAITVTGGAPPEPAAPQQGSRKSATAPEAPSVAGAAGPGADARDSRAAGTLSARGRLEQDRTADVPAAAVNDARRKRDALVQAVARESAASRDTDAADALRFEAIAAAAETYRMSGAEQDAAVTRTLAGAYLAREDARRAAAVRILLREAGLEVRER